MSSHACEVNTLRSLAGYAEAFCKEATGIKTNQGFGRKGKRMSDTEHVREQLIRERAYPLWDADGRPDGRAEEYWEMARQEVEDAENVAPDA